VVLEHVNIHSSASLYATFPLAEARRITRKWSFCDAIAPKMAECGRKALAVLAFQCMNRRLASLQSSVTRSAPESGSGIRAAFIGWWAMRARVTSIDVACITPAPFEHLVRAQERCLKRMMH
jgi:hypothetical protein